MAHTRFGLALAVFLVSFLGTAQPARGLVAPAETGSGAAAPDARLERMLLLLSPPADRQQALTAELENLENPASAEFHHWLTPAAFAAAYSISDEDAGKVAAWLRSQGFEVASLPAGRGWIEFTGTVAQVERAFHTRIHSAPTATGERAILAGELIVPASLKPLVHGLVSLDGAVSAPALTAPLPVKASAAELAAAASLGAAEALTPQLAAALLHLDALHAAGTTGAGEEIAIAARSNVGREDIAAFRAAFALPASPLEVNLNGGDPGRNSDEAEAALAASWAGAAAPGARIVLVPAATTSATDGLDLALAAIVDQALAQTVVVGYSICEAGLSETHSAFYAALYRQAAAQGMAVIAASGDSGAAACHAAGSDAPVSCGYGVNALASTPWNTAIGVAALGAANGTVLSGWSTVNAADPAYASGGGRSTLYDAPGWQRLPAKALQESGVAHRLLPDLALPTAIDSGIDRGLAFCLSGDSAADGCTLVRSGGSSAAAAIFAGIAALVAQKNGPQGNLTPNLYALSRQSGIFDDILEGSARLQCAAGSAGCDADGQIGFSAGAGYDLATGLGVPNAQALVTRWAATPYVGKGADQVNITSGSATINPSAPITIDAQVISLTGGATPTGTVLFFDTTTHKNLSNTPSTVEANGTASLSVEGGFANGSNEIEAQYSGDATYAANTSGTVDILVTQGDTNTAIVPSTYTPVVGATVTVTASITVTSFPGNAPPTGTIALQLDGKPSSTQPVKIVSGTPEAVFPVVISSSGVHNLQAIYSGDANYVPSTSPQVTVTAAAATKSATVTTLTATPTVLTAGVPESFTATIAPASGVTSTAAITGTVKFYDGTALLGMATVASGTATLSGVMLSTTVAHSITAVYSGDTNWATSTSNAIAFPVATLLPDTVTLTASTSVVSPGGVVTLTATVTPLSMPPAGVEQNPTGKVVFYDGAKSLATVALTPGLNDTATATLVSATLPGGQNTITAAYLGDLTFKPATSNSVTVDVQDFTITPAPTIPPTVPGTNLNIVQGSAGSAAFIVASVGGFKNEVQVVCAVPSQDDMTCTASPQQVIPTATVTFVVQTFSTGTTPLASANSKPRPEWPGAAGATALAMLGFFLLPLGRRARIFAGRSARRFMVLLLLLVGLGGVGIGCNSFNLNSGPGTPLGVATLKITAAAYIDNTVVSHSVYLTVNVEPKN